MSKIQNSWIAETPFVINSQTKDESVNNSFCDSLFRVSKYRNDTFISSFHHYHIHISPSFSSQFSYQILNDTFCSSYKRKKEVRTNGWILRFPDLEGNSAKKKKIIRSWLMVSFTHESVPKNNKNDLHIVSWRCPLLYFSSSSPPNHDVWWCVCFDSWVKYHLLIYSSLN